MIINNQDSFEEIVSFCKKYFKRVKCDRKRLNLARNSQNFSAKISFENRGVTFNIIWNYYGGKLIVFNDKEQITLQYYFSKMDLDSCYPIENGNNYNVVFWQYEITHTHDDIPEKISPFRIPVTVSKSKDHGKM